MKIAAINLSFRIIILSEEGNKNRRTRCAGCDKSRTQRTNICEQICCVHQVSGSDTRFYLPK